MKNGDDVVNACDSLDSITIATLAMARSSALDWKLPVQYALDHFTQTVTAGGKTFSGFDLVSPQGSARVGVAWTVRHVSLCALHALFSRLLFARIVAASLPLPSSLQGRPAAHTRHEWLLPGRRLGLSRGLDMESLQLFRERILQSIVTVLGDLVGEECAHFGASPK